MPEPQDRRLPLELLLAIADQLGNHLDMLCFALTCKDLYTFLVKKPRRSLDIQFERSQCDLTTTAAPEYLLLNQQAAVMMVPCMASGSEFHDLAGLGSCNCTVTDEQLAAVNHRFSQNGYKEITLSGRFPTMCDVDVASHPIIRSSGFRAIEPETFNVELSRIDWDFSVLKRISVTNLKNLKLPISQPLDVSQLGKALTTMPRLVSLTITDISDLKPFLCRLGHLGRGILSCASTLRELDLEIRPKSTWRDEHFVWPKEGVLFQILFPCPPMEEYSALSERQSQIDSCPVAETPLHLTKLRLKHLILPWYSFDKVFDATAIKHLDLPYSMVNSRALRRLETDAQLETLAAVSFDMVFPGFLHFLSRQSSLTELTFVRPHYNYGVDGIPCYGPTPSMTHRSSRRGHPRDLKPEDVYPTFDDFLSSLEDMKKLKHLVLPIDMYTITDRAMMRIAASLTGLEDLELGFKYTNHGLQQAFASYILYGMRALKKITFQTATKSQLRKKTFDGTVFEGFIESLGETVPANLKLLRYVSQSHDNPPREAKVFYHRETPLDGEWWIRLPADESGKIFAEGRTPRIVPVSQWDWEIEEGPKRRGIEWTDSRLGTQRRRKLRTTIRMGSFGKP